MPHEKWHDINSLMYIAAIFSYRQPVLNDNPANYSSWSARTPPNGILPTTYRHDFASGASHLSAIRRLFYSILSWIKPHLHQVKRSVLQVRCKKPTRSPWNILVQDRFTEFFQLPLPTFSSRVSRAAHPRMVGAVPSPCR